MNKTHSRVKEELMDLFGTISVDEIIANEGLTSIITDISKTLKNVSILDHYQY